MRGTRLNEVWLNMSDEEKGYVIIRISEICAKLAAF